MSNFWDLVWLMFGTFFFISYLMILFQVVADLFRDSKLGGVAKGVWIVALVFLPLLTALAYVITRGRGMAERQRAVEERTKSDAEAYIRQVAGGPSPADQIASAKKLLDAGTISQEEFARLKAKALA
jgi:Short C-terminal domain